MIINCPECTTKFQVAPERIPVRGAKVRCARCRHVFFVPGAEVPTETEQTVSAEASGAATPEKASVHTEERTEAETPPGKTAPDGDFNYDRFQELDGRGEEAIADQAGSASSAKSSPAAHSSEPPLATGDSAEPPVEGGENVGPIEKIFSEKSQDSAQSSAADALENAAQEPVEPETAPHQDQPTSYHQEQKGSPLATLVKLLLLLILAILIIGGILIYTQGPDQVGATLQQLFSGQQPPPSAGHIQLSNLEGRFIADREAGELFVISGEAINNFSEPRAAIQVRGIIFDQQGAPLLQKTVFCGNPISDEDLESLPFAELEKFMGNQFGNKLSNLKVNQNQAIPFTIAFKNLPDNMAEFSVKVTASKPATN